MSAGAATAILFVGLIVVIATGLPVVFVLGGTSLIIALFLLGPDMLGMTVNAMFSVMNNFGFLAVPLFIFMAAILERSGVADDLYEMMHKWFGGVPGGLAMGTVVICTIFAAMSGVSAAGIVAMGLIALPNMLKRNYDKTIAIGCVAAGGGLGQLIPPSSMMIVWALTAGESIGQMFMGGIIPGLILAVFYIIYIAIACRIDPKKGPPLPKEERASWSEKLATLKAVILPIFLILAVLGSMFGGIATATEAAAIGSLGAVICALIYRRFTWQNFIKSNLDTFKLVCMVCWIVSAGITFGNVFAAVGGQQFIIGALNSLGLNRWVILIGIQLIYLFLGCLMDPWAIMILSIPIFVPLMHNLGFNTMWFGVLFIINMELGFLTPPFGPNLFYMKAIVPKGITTVDIYKSIVPFISLQALCLAICMAFPITITFIPGLLIKGPG
ncbi:MAG: transporter permease DctM/Q [Chloroflexi bacterium]|nr:transporter permease DctM/Q [Chloroflexota bacterium]